MTPHPQTARLIHWLATALQTEICAGDDILEYARTVFGTTDLIEILAFADSGEADSLLDLIFYPDFDLQLRYEQRWGTAGFSEGDRQMAVARLNANPLTGFVRTARSAAPLKIELPGWIRDAFVRRLNITWRFDPAIAEVLERHQPLDQQVRTRVHLRNARQPRSPHQTALLKSFFEKISCRSTDYAPCLLFLLPLLDEFMAGQSAYDFLISKKEFYFQSLCKADDFERRRVSANMEILMLQGERAAHGSIAGWRDRMRCIDTLCLALFGQTRYFGQPRNVHTTIQPTENGWDLDHVFNTLG